MRVASLDIGTNTVLLLIAELDGERLVTIEDHHAIARLGEGVDRTRRISEAAYERFIAILKDHVTIIERSNCNRIAAIATSAMRDAENRDEIIARTQRDTGIQIELLSGADEAAWTYRGAIAGMKLQRAIGVIDIGGGSTEISFGNDDAFVSGVSTNIGAVRITERFAPIPTSRVAASKHIRETLLCANITPTPLEHFVAVAGTPTSLSAMQQHLKVFDVNTVHGDMLTRESIEELLALMFTLSQSELLARFPAVSPARIDILPAGTLILAEAMDLLGAKSVTVSTQGLRYGIALRELTR